MPGRIIAVSSRKLDQQVLSIKAYRSDEGWVLLSHNMMGDWTFGLHGAFLIAFSLNYVIKEDRRRPRRHAYAYRSAFLLSFVSYRKADNSSVLWTTVQQDHIVAIINMDDVLE